MSTTNPTLDTIRRAQFVQTIQSLDLARRRAVPVRGEGRHHRPAARHRIAHADGA